MRALWVIAVAAAAFGVDQLTKQAAIAALEAAEVWRIEALPFLNIVHARNTGVNFGICASTPFCQPWALASFAVLVSVGLLIWALRAEDRRIAAGSALMIGGALGNALDRLATGAVVDFINLDCCGIGNPYAFNIADTAIFGGAALILWASWRDADARGEA